MLVLRFIRQNQRDSYFALLIAASLIGVATQAMLPAPPGAEMWHLANGLVLHGSFANPFNTIPTGPTAANPPLYPLLLACLIKLFRTPTLYYEAAVIVSILLNAITATLLPRVSLLCFGDATPGFFGSILWFPTMQNLPGWDTNCTISGLVFFCISSLSLKNERRSQIAEVIVRGVVAGLLFLLNPATLLIVLPWLSFLLLHSDAKQIRSRKGNVLVLALLCIFISGWCGRNYWVLGKFVSRTNLGMTLYSSNNDCAQSTLYQDVRIGCYQSHHPNVSLAEALLVKQLGEVEYDQNRIKETKKWIATHPKDFLKLSVRRFVEFWFPAIESASENYPLPNSFNIPDYALKWKDQQNRIAISIWIVTGLSLPGIVLMLRRRERFVIFAIATSVIYPIMYYAVVSDMRYRYPILWISLLAAGYFIRELIEPANARSAPTWAQP